MTTPTVPPTTEPVEVPPPPEPDPCVASEFGPRIGYGTTRDGLLPCDLATGEVVEWPPPATFPPPDDCVPNEIGSYPGTTRQTIMPCDPATGEILDWPQEAETVAVVAVRRDPAPVELQELPVTGAGDTAIMLVVGAGLVAAGASLRKFARR